VAATAMASAASQDINRDHSPTRPSTPPRSRGLAGVASGGIGDGREWRSVGKHPSLEMKHTVEDRLMIATNISYLLFRAFLHRSRDKIVCYSQMIREITSSGQNQSDRALVITDVHLYVIQMPSGAMFAPPSTGGCFALTDFSKMSLVTGTQHCLFQFVGATIAMRFSSAKDAQRCGNVIFSLTAVPVEAIAPNELGSLHTRRIIGAPQSLSQSINALAATHTAGVDSDGDSGDHNAPSVAHSKAAPLSAAQKKGIPTTTSSTVAGGASSVDNMLRFILESSENHAYESLYPEAGVQTEQATAEFGVSCAPETRDATTSPIRRRESPHRSHPREHGGHGVINRKFDVDYAESDAESSSGLSEFDSGAMWRSLQRGGQPATMPSGSHAVSRSPHRSHGENNIVAPNVQQSFDAWLGLLAPYKDGLQQQGLDSIGKLARLDPTDLEAAMDAAGISRTGHRMLLASKVNLTRQSRTRGVGR
jgi:hypothetical protein